MQGSFFLPTWEEISRCRRGAPLRGLQAWCGLAGPAAGVVPAGPGPALTGQREGWREGLVLAKLHQAAAAILLLTSCC